MQWDSPEHLDHRALGSDRSPIILPHITTRLQKEVGCTYADRKKEAGAGDVAELVEGLPSMHEALGSIHG